MKALKKSDIETVKQFVQDPSVQVALAKRGYYFDHQEFMRLIKEQVAK